MRSRYTAYVLGDTEYILQSWHGSTRPASLELDDRIQWLRLKIIEADDDHVEFVATYRLNGKAYKLREKSRFVFEGGRCYYVDGVSSDA